MGNSNIVGNPRIFSTKKFTQHLKSILNLELPICCISSRGNFCFVNNTFSKFFSIPQTSNLPKQKIQNFFPKHQSNSTDSNFLSLKIEKKLLTSKNGFIHLNWEFLIGYQHIYTELFVTLIENDGNRIIKIVVYPLNKTIKRSSEDPDKPVENKGITDPKKKIKKRKKKKKKKKQSQRNDIIGRSNTYSGMPYSKTDQKFELKKRALTSITVINPNIYFENETSQINQRMKSNNLFMPIENNNKTFNLDLLRKRKKRRKRKKVNKIQRIIKKKKNTHKKHNPKKSKKEINIQLEKKYGQLLFKINNLKLLLNNKEELSPTKFTINNAIEDMNELIKQSYITHLNNSQIYQKFTSKHNEKY
ncbi:hypothetical protein M0813_02282 [Anaeramoeba flamelloides]|uniref:PAS domain-containing protein n=1 Tax=Anaeramoeba flamelloides TaxID=1746091 RepID=A0ABQ8YKI9_9EUKA|nr:hypothetical protein M0813_02282 [Anaeramoeba flamelloides]